MSYTRVIPRDLFNEANLLKCYGRLAILSNTITAIGFREESTDCFEIVQDESDGSLTIANLTFTVHGKPVRLYRPLNSRSSYPLYAEINGEEIQVFTEEGDFAPEMDHLIRHP